MAGGGSCCAKGYGREAGIGATGVSLLARVVSAGRWKCGQYRGSWKRLPGPTGVCWRLLAFAWTYETAHGQLSASERVLAGSCGFCGLCLVPLMDSVRGFILGAEVRGKGHGRRSGKLGWAMSEEAVRK